MSSVCRLDQRTKLRDPARAHEQCAQTEHQAIEGGEIRRAMAAAIADQKLMFEQKGFCGDGADTPWAEQLCDGDQQVDGQDEEVAHAAHRSMTATERKTAPHGLIPSYCEFATDRMPNLLLIRAEWDAEADVWVAFNQ